MSAEGTKLDYHGLRQLNVHQLREVAKTAPGLTGATQMNKDKLLKEICTRLQIEMHEHHEVVGVIKADVKERIRALKKQREAALAAKDAQALAKVRAQIHKAKGQLRRATM
jgi:hypothetical protein